MCHVNNLSGWAFFILSLFCKPEEVRSCELCGLDLSDSENDKVCRGDNNRLKMGKWERYFCTAQSPNNQSTTFSKISFVLWFVFINLIIISTNKHNNKKGTTRSSSFRPGFFPRVICMALLCFALHSGLLGHVEWQLAEGWLFTVRCIHDACKH